MATRIRTLDHVVAAAGYSVAPNSVVTLSDDALATALITAGKAVAMADATTLSATFGTGRWVMYQYGTGAV